MSTRLWVLHGLFLWVSTTLTAAIGHPNLPTSVNPDTLSVTSLPWVRAGDSYRSTGHDIALDKMGNIYVVGYYEQYIDLGKGQRWAEGEDLNNADIFIAKYDPMGNLQWMQTAGSQEDDKGLGIALSDDQVFITGYFSGICYFGDQPLLTKDRQNMFVAAYSMDGKLNWVKQAKSDGILRGQAITADQSGHVYITGNFREIMTFDDLTVKKQMNQNIYLLKLSPSGDGIWLRQAAGGNSLITYAYVYDLACDANNHIVMAGEMMGPVRFGSINYTTSREWYADGPLPMREVYLAKWNSNGQLEWFDAIAVEANFGDLAIDGENNILVTGHFLGTLEGKNKGIAKLGGQTATTHYDLFGDCTEDIYLAKYTPGGKPLWVEHFGGMQADRGQGITADAAGNVYVTGYFTGSMTYKGFEVASKKYRVDAKDAFVAKFTKTGEIEWIETAGSTKKDEGKCTIADGKGNIYISGYFEGNASFGRNWVTSKRYGSFYLAKYNAIKLY